MKGRKKEEMKEWTEAKKKKKEETNTNPSISSLAFSTKSLLLFFFSFNKQKIGWKNFSMSFTSIEFFLIKFLRYFRKVTHTQAHNHTHIRIHINIYACMGWLWPFEKWTKKKIGIRNTVLLYRYIINVHRGTLGRRHVFKFNKSLSGNISLLFVKFEFEAIIEI